VKVDLAPQGAAPKCADLCACNTCTFQVGCAGIRGKGLPAQEEGSHAGEGGGKSTNEEVAKAPALAHSRRGHRSTKQVPTSLGCLHKEPQCVVRT